jgi:hypothetical protein
MSAATVPAVARTTRIELVNVTPELAEFWLTQNQSNRRVRRTIWKSYARDMQAGAWKLTAEPVKLSPEGKLLDGQHRLHAVVDAGVTVPMFVAYDVPDDAQAAMDSGAKRTASDALALRGDSQTSLVAATARIALGVAYSPESIGRYTATHAEIMDWVDNYPDVFDAASFISNIQSRLKGCRPSMATYTLLMLSQIDHDQAYSFWSAVADQVGDYPGDPVLALARRFGEAYREREQLSHSAQLSMIYRAWNSRRGNKPLRIVRVNSPGAAGGLIPVPVPR